MPLRAIVTAGGTTEPIDDVRAIVNFSRGTFGAAIASALSVRGVRVSLVGSQALCERGEPIDPRARPIPFGSHADLAATLADLAHDDPPDLLFMAAAVADYAPVVVEGKISSAREHRTIELTRTPKILSSLRDLCGERTVLVGFKLLSGASPEELHAAAREQIERDRLDLCFANDLASVTRESHAGWIVPASGDPVPVSGSKSEAASGLVDFVLERTRVASGSGTTRIALDSDGAGRALAAEIGLAEPEVDPPFEESARRWAREHLPPHEALVHLGEAVHLSGAMTRRPHAGGSLPEIEAVHRALTRGTPVGEGWLVALSGGGYLLGVEPGGIDRLRDEWAAARVAWDERGQELGRPAGLEEASLVPLLDGSRIVGILAGLGEATIPFLLPACRGVGRGDRIAEAFEREGRSVAVLEGCRSEAYFRERGFRLRERRSEFAILEAPSQRDDLRPAASIGLYHAATGSVLLGRRLTPPWEGCWAFPGGGREPGETPFRNAAREFEEETGLSVPLRDPLLETTVTVSSEDGDRAYRVVNFTIPVLVRREPVATDELVPEWIPLAEALERRPMGAGTRRILRRLVDRWGG